MSIIKDFIDEFLVVTDGLDDANPDDLDRATDAAKKIAIAKYYGFPLPDMPAEPEACDGDSEEEQMLRLRIADLEDPDNGYYHGQS
ncbi:protein of unknown function [Acidithiobacillus ferrivorans]|nr:hypothetical protein [Acidithiobacillus ferrivorans]SMH64178.1 protein of unknown function [Acidithiobacillus ferrivorans]